MTILEALSLLDIADINGMDEMSVKKKYRVLIKKNHPDIGGDEELVKKLNDAYQIIDKPVKELEVYKQLSKKDLPTWLIPFDKLPKLYMGESVEIIHNNEKTTLTRKNLSYDRIILLIIASIQYKGELFSFENLCVNNIKDEYTIECRLVDTDISNEEELVIMVHDKTINTIIKGSRIDMKLSFDNLVKLTMHIERVELHG